jgi:hypothetical protein
MAGILFAKFTKPSMRAETFMFSKVTFHYLLIVISLFAQ